jgi:arginase
LWEYTITRFLSTKKVVCLEVAEINPLLDNKGNKMAETAFDVLAKIEKHIRQWPVGSNQ